MKKPATAAGKGEGGFGILRRLVAPHKWRVLLLASVSLASALLEALFIVLLTGIAMALVSGVDVVGSVLGRDLNRTTATIVAAFALLLRITIALWSVWISTALTAQVTATQRRRLASAFLRSSWAVQQSEPSGRLQELLTSFVSRTTQAVSTLTGAMTAALSLIAFIITGVALEPVALLAVVVALAMVGGILLPLRRAIRRRARRNAQASLAFASSVAELGSLGMEMQTYGAAGHFESRIHALTEKTTTTLRQTQQLQGAQPHIYMSLAYGAVLLGVAAVSSIEAGELGAIGAVMLLMLRSLSYAQQLSTASAAMAGYLPFLENIEETVGRYSESPALTGSRQPSAVVPIKACGVEFTYDGQRITLADVNVTLSRGEAIGVIGPSGAGKSTFAQLVLGLRSPTGGTITADGTPLDDVDRSWWTDRVAFVAQDANLITGTVAENIRFFRDGLGEHDLRRAAAQANVLADIEALPQGFDTHLGERGSQLSGGQRQRLSIARALVGSPQLLVLDEPTSALDGQSEALIRSTLQGLRGQLSIFIIAHRMSTLDICDKIMVIESGRMTALDTPERLRANSEFYRRALKTAGIT